VTLEVIVLALGSAPRPAGVAALYALLSASHPRRVLVAYVVAGFAFSVAVGVLFVAFFHGANLRHENDTVNGLIQLLAGAAALGYAAGVGSGKTQLPSRDPSADRPRMTQRLLKPSVATAALAGVATHLPGLFYLVALNAIATHGDSLGVGVLEVLLFNGIWFSAAIASVVIFLIRPGAARRALSRVNGWARRHARATTVTVFVVVGSYLTVNGAVTLLR
jgi:hypothetical protein